MKAASSLGPDLQCTCRPSFVKARLARNSLSAGAPDGGIYTTLCYLDLNQTNKARGFFWEQDGINAWTVWFSYVQASYSLFGRNTAEMDYSYPELKQEFFDEFGHTINMVKGNISILATYKRNPSSLKTTITFQIPNAKFDGHIAGGRFQGVSQFDNYYQSIYVNGPTFYYFNGWLQKFQRIQLP